MSKIIPHLFQAHDSMLCWSRTRDRQRRAGQRHIRKASFPYTTTVVRDLKGASLVIVQATS